jgi:hypothetical protein
MKISRPILFIMSVILALASCKKTYEEGPAISFKTKFSRITGKWRLVSMEGEMKDGSPIVRLQPEIDQFIEFTKEEVPSITEGEFLHKVYYTNFQEEYQYIENGLSYFDDTLFTLIGSWWFIEWDKKKDGLYSTMEDSGSKNPYVTSWKILKLTNSELKLINYRKGSSNYGDRTITLEKIN